MGRTSGARVPLSVRRGVLPARGAADHDLQRYGGHGLVRGRHRPSTIGGRDEVAIVPTFGSTVGSSHAATLWIREPSRGVGHGHMTRTSGPTMVGPGDPGHGHEPSNQGDFIRPRAGLRAAGLITGAAPRSPLAPCGGRSSTSGARSSTSGARQPGPWAGQRPGTGRGRRVMPRRSRSACSARAAATSSGSCEIVLASQSM